MANLRASSGIRGNDGANASYHSTAKIEKIGTEKLYTEQKTFYRKKKKKNPLL